MTPLPTADTAAASSDPQRPEVPLPAPQADPAPVPVVQAPGNWFVQEEAVVGLAHRIKNLPCQDAAQAVGRPRTALVLADGAGSSAVSEIGARAVVHSTIRLLDTLDKPLSAWLDHECPELQQQARTWGLLLVKHAIGTLKDLAAEHRRELRDFRCTFLVAVVGRRHLFWLKVGDGAIVLEKRKLQAEAPDRWDWVHELFTLGEQGKGEFANQTQFLDGIAPDEVQIGCLDIEAVSGLALMSDGAAERLVANDGSRVATRVSTLLAQLRQDKLRRSVLTRMFYEEDFCTGTSGDDRSIALAACVNPVTAHAPLRPETEPLLAPAQESALVQHPCASPTVHPKKPRRKRR